MRRRASTCPTTGCPSCGRSPRRLEGLTGFRVAPVPGLVPTRVFYGSLADRTFCSTQYIRHHSVPLYTPEPDVVHELVGHCNMLASPVFAELYQLAGQASRRAESDAALEFFSRVFWFTFEFGVAWEDGELRTYGAGLLSSFGELDAFRDAEVRPFDLDAMGTTDYDITVYQPAALRRPLRGPRRRRARHVPEHLRRRRLRPPHRLPLLTAAEVAPLLAGRGLLARRGLAVRRSRARSRRRGSASRGWPRCDDPAPEPWRRRPASP